jgi:hypothetical protein
MAKRLNPRHSDLVVKRIQTSQLINRLQDNALGEFDMDPTAAANARFLIERTLAKAEAPRQLNVNLSLSDLIKQSVDARDQ